MNKNKSASHIKCEYEATAYVRFCHLGHYSLEPNDYLHASISKVLDYIPSVGLLGWGEGDWKGCTIDLNKLAVHGPMWSTTYSFIQAAQ
jgi:hypothetical protein